MAKILVVDDEAGIRNIIKKYATFEGYEIAEASDGMQAIDMCRTMKFDLIIMDVMMPERLCSKAFHSQGIDAAGWSYFAQDKSSDRVQK